MKVIPLRNRQSEAFKRLKGNPSKSRIRTEIKPARGNTVPAPPKHLTALAKAEWQRTAPLLWQIGMLTVLDHASFAVYCSAYGRWLDAEAQMRSQSMVVTTAKGNEVQAVLVGIARRAAADAMRFGSEFGLNPAGRTRLALAAERAPKDDFDDLLAHDDDPSAG